MRFVHFLGQKSRALEHVLLPSRVRVPSGYCQVNTFIAVRRRSLFDDKDPGTTPIKVSKACAEKSARHDLLRTPDQLIEPPPRFMCPKFAYLRALVGAANE
jgi:hypothetical protein